nr:MAG TPA: hypothetical protein [Caudoviricetes sp.]
MPHTLIGITSFISLMLTNCSNPQFSHILYANSFILPIALFC